MPFCAQLLSTVSRLVSYIDTVDGDERTVLYSEMPARKAFNGRGHCKDLSECFLFCSDCKACLFQVMTQIL